MEAIATIAALGGIFGVVIAKALVTYHTRLMKRQIAQVDQDRSRVLGQLKALEAQSKVATANRNSLTKKRDRLQKKMERLNAEMGEYQSDRERRQMQRERARGKLIRPTRAGSGAAAEPMADAAQFDTDP